MDSVTIAKFIEVGSITGAFLIVLIVFVLRVLAIMDKRAEQSATAQDKRAEKTTNVLERGMRDIVMEIRGLIAQQRTDSDRIAQAITTHDERSQIRSDRMHETIRQAIAGHIKGER